MFVNMFSHLTIDGILLIVLGIMASPSLILSKKADAQKILDKLTPYQGWAGLIFCVVGIVQLIKALANTVPWIEYFTFGWLMWLVGGLLLILLGFILGYGMISKYALSKNETAKEKGEQLMKKLIPLQGILGVAAIVLGIFMLIYLAVQYE